jgi:hypothetical protein
MLMCPSTNSKRFKLTYIAYMIAGIHPLLNHAVTQIVKLNMIHSHMHSCASMNRQSAYLGYILCNDDYRHSSITQSCGNTNVKLNMIHSYIHSCHRNGWMFNAIFPTHRYLFNHCTGFGSDPKFSSVFSSEVVGCMPIDDSYVIDIDSTIPQTDFKYM